MGNNRVLGKGLSALLNGADFKGGPVPAAVPVDASSVVTIPLEAIEFNPGQPRKTFNNIKLEELAASIKQVGILQPVLVRRQPAEGAAAARSGAAVPAALYSIVAGERRVRASRLAGLTEIPALICSYEETEALRVALLENIQREDLGPVEEGEAYRNLMAAYGATQEELAEMLGKSRSSVANTVRILALEQEILSLLQEGKITRGHAKALLGMPAGPARLQLAKMCGSRGLSVRECELRAQAGGAKQAKKVRRKARKGVPTDPTIRALMERTERVYGSPVTIEREAKSGKGAIQLRFYSDDDLVRLLKIMGVDTEL